MFMTFWRLSAELRSYHHQLRLGLQACVDSCSYICSVYYAIYAVYLLLQLFLLCERLKSSVLGQVSTPPLQRAYLPTTTSSFRAQRMEIASEREPH